MFGDKITLPEPLHCYVYFIDLLLSKLSQSPCEALFVSLRCIFMSLFQ